MPDAPSVSRQGWETLAVRQPDPETRAYNSGMAVVEGRTFLATRHFDRRDWRCEIRINELRADGSVSPVRRLDLPRACGREAHEDARLVLHNGRWHCAYTEGRYSRRPWVAVQCLAILRDDWSVERTIGIDYGTNGSGTEKNWQFFSSGGLLHFVYSIFPEHVVVGLDADYRPVAEFRSPAWLDLPLRGGTPPVRTDEGWVTFPHYHTAHPERTRCYGFVALRFEPVAPFRITGVTKPLVVASPEDRTLPNLAYPHWHPLVVFPCGAVLMDDGAWRVSAGVNDSTDAIFSIPHERLEFRPVVTDLRASA